MASATSRTDTSHVKSATEAQYEAPSASWDVPPADTSFWLVLPRQDYKLLGH